MRDGHLGFRIGRHHLDDLFGAVEQHAHQLVERLGGFLQILQRVWRQVALGDGSVLRQATLDQLQLLLDGLHVLDDVLQQQAGVARFVAALDHRPDDCGIGGDRVAGR